MKTLKIILSSVLIFSLSIFVIQCFYKKVLGTNINNKNKEPINISVLFDEFDDIFHSELRKNLKFIEEENKDKVKFTFFDGKRNSVTDNEIVDKLIQNKTNLLVLVLPDQKEDVANQSIYKAKQKGIPTILFNATPTNLDVIKNYKKSLIIRANPAEAGIIQGNILVDAWKNDKKSIDKNLNNIMEYVLLRGNPNSIETPLRTETSLKTITDAGIQTQELASVTCNWDKDCAKNSMESLFLRYGPKIEVIISNNDAMAIGAIEALQKYGYNTGNKLKNVTILGIDALPEAQDLIKKGVMLGTVTQDPKAMSEAIYTVGLNLVYEKNPTENTNYKFDNTGVTIIIPHEKFLK